MGERRMGDRREKEKGVIKVKLHEAIVIIVITIVLLISISANIILAIKYNQYKTYFYDLAGQTEYEDVDDYEED